MSKENETGKSAAGTLPTNDRMEKMRAGRGRPRATTSNLGSSAAFCVRLLGQARSGAKIVQDQIKAGRMPSPEVVDAAAVLAGAAASSMLE